MRENISKALEELVGEVTDGIGIVCLRLAFGVQFWIEFIQVGARMHYILHSVEFLSKCILHTLSPPVSLIPLAWPL